MNFRVIQALVMRYLYLYTRAPVRGIELVFWPMVNLLVWGYLTQYLQKNMAGDFPGQITYLIGAVILWDVLFRAQQGVAIFFLEDVWTRNLLNVFAAPVTTRDYLAATYTIGLLRALVTTTLLGVLSWVLYSFNVFSLHGYLLPFALNLLVFGWALGMISTALIVRWGPAAETLAWAVPFFIQPFAAVFFPMSELPAVFRAFSMALPCSYVFEGMREVLRSGSVSTRDLLLATGLNLVYLAAAGVLFVRVMRTARRKGLLTKFATQ
ncbi:MAG: ABC transporter permease [Verrucomicrobiae bacterium]|nr:ABC transporter permease [Verrucomicrobiae bacterium]MCP5542222.1 ABC transporter permease [Akkermansiaceae bacterium]